MRSRARVDKLGPVTESSLYLSTQSPEEELLCRAPNTILHDTNMHQHHTINYIELPAKNLVDAKAFYSAVFGWSFQDYGDDYCAFNDGRSDGGFYRSDMWTSAASGAALVVLYSSDLEATRDAIQENGGTITRDIFSFPGGRRFHFVDPNRNELAVWSE